MVYFACDAGALTGLTVWLGGALLIVLGGRRLVRLDTVVEVLGCVGVLVGAAVVGAQWDEVAPLAGIVTGLGLLALGMLPGRVLLSVTGSLGLLVNIPWTIGRFFPGERRAVLILVSGALILLIAALMTRLRGRFRGELGRSGEMPSRKPPGADTRPLSSSGRARHR
jgi:hypothetical protein